MIRMRFQRTYLVWVVLAAFGCALVSSCATPPPRPKVVLPVAGYPNAVSVAGVTVAAVPFDPNRDLYAAPNEPNPRKPDLNWFKAGVCPTRLLFSSDAEATYVINPLQITCTDAAGVVYKPYNPREAGYIVVASEAFSTFVGGAVAGTILGAVLGAGLGAAVGGIAGGGGAAARGAAIGAGVGGGYGLLVGPGATRSQLESRVSAMIYERSLTTQPLSRGMTCEGLVYFPAVNITSVRVLLADAAGPQVLDVNIPVVMPRQDPPLGTY